LKYSSTLSLTSALDGDGCSTPRPTVLPQGKRPGTHCTFRHVLYDRINTGCPFYGFPEQRSFIAKRACIRRDILYVQGHTKFGILKAGLYQFVSLAILSKATAGLMTWTRFSIEKRDNQRLVTADSLLRTVDLHRAHLPKCVSTLLAFLIRGITSQHITDITDQTHTIQDSGSTFIISQSNLFRQ
jgi:hypothetical protein